MRTLEEVIAAQSPESQAIIKAMADEMILETGLQMMKNCSFHKNRLLMQWESVSPL